MALDAAHVESWRRAGCRCDPFSAAADPSMFFATSASRRVQSSLLSGLETGQGCLFLITGEAGIGKTMQLHVLEAVLRVAGETVMVHDGADGAASWLDRLAAGDTAAKPVIDLVDGAERFSAATIDRLVAALRMSEGRGFPARLVIAARSEIEPRLYALVGAALSTQASFNWLRLDRVDGFDVESLVLHRLRRAGYVDVSPLTPDALRRIIEEAGGIPRRILDLAAPEIDSVWRRAAAVGAIDGGMRARSRPMRRAFAAATLPLLVAGAWMLLPTDVIRRAEMSADRFVVERFSGTPPQVPRGSSAVAAPVSVMPAIAAPDAEAPLRERQVATVVDRAGATEAGWAGAAGSTRLESLIAPGDPEDPIMVPIVAIVHDAAVPPPPVDGAGNTGSEEPRSAPAAVTPEADVAIAAPVPVIAPRDLEHEPSEPAVAVVHPELPAGTSRPSLASSSMQGDGRAPPVLLAQAAASTQLSGEQVASLMRRGDEQLREGNIAGARLFYDRAASAGDARAMRALARTYDPQELRQLGVVGLSADPERARFWLKKAEETEAAPPGRRQ